MSQAFKLFRLQQIDSQIDHGRNRMREIEAILSDSTTLNHAKQQADEADAHLIVMRKDLQRAEVTVQNQRIKIEQTEAALYGGKVRNPKELQDLQNESAALKRYLNTLEDRQLDAIMVVEEAELDFQAKSETLSRVITETEQLSQQLVKEQSALLQEVKHLEDERLAGIASIPAADLALYEKLRQQRRGVAVAKANGNMCAACGAALNSSLQQAARSPNQLARCDSCGRILYAG
jgi:hypothetical protein